MIRILLAISLPGLTVLPALAATPTFTPDAAVAYAMRHNPDLQAARHRIAEAEGRLLHAGQKQSPEIEAEIKPNVEGREFAAGVGLVQKFPFSQRLRLEKRVSEVEVAVATDEVRSAERVLEWQIRTLIVRVLDVRSRRDVHQRQSDYSRELAEAAGRAAAAGEGSALLAAGIDLEAGETAVRRMELDAEESAHLAALRPLLGLPPTASLRLTGELGEPVAPKSEGSITVDALPDMRAAEARIQAATDNIALQRASKWEDLAVGVSYEREHVEDAGYGLRRENFLGLKLTIPLPLGKNNLSHVREAEATARRRTAERDALAASLRAEAAAARAAMAAAAAIYAQTTTTLLPKARQLEDRFFTAYQAGQSPLTDVLRSREKRLALESVRLNAQRDYHLARIRHQAVVGR